MSPPPASHDLWIRRYRPAENPMLRLACFPHAGGASSAYLPFARELPADIDVLAVQYPGRQDRRAEPFADSIDALAGQVMPALEHWADRPLALFGHSLGAMVAYEVARLFEASAPGTLTRLFVSGRRAPSVPRRDTTYLLDDQTLISELRKLQGTEDAVLADEELLRMVLPVIRNDYRIAAGHRYRPGPVLSCPVTVLIGDQDPNVTPEEAAAWAQATTGKTTVRTFHGGHFYLKAHLTAVCETITGAVGRDPAPADRTADARHR